MLDKQDCQSVSPKSGCYRLARIVSFKSTKNFSERTETIHESMRGKVERPSKLGAIFTATAMGETDIILTYVNYSPYYETLCLTVIIKKTKMSRTSSWFNSWSLVSYECCLDFLQNGLLLCEQWSYTKFLTMISGTANWSKLDFYPEKSWLFWIHFVLKSLTMNFSTSSSGICIS